MKKSIKKVVCILILICSVSMFVTGCSGKISRKNVDGTVTKIKYESAVPLQRAPYFKEYTDHVDMTFNGMVWYSAYLANKSDVEKYDDYTLLAQSTNTKVYYEKDESDAKIQRDFVYVMDLGGTDEGYIIFIAAYSPWNNYNDFDTGIQYLVNGKQTEMDSDFEFLIDEQEFYDEQDRQEEEENTRDV